MKLRMLVAAVALVLVVSLGAGSTVFAGEITGNGKETPIKAQQEFPDNPAGPANSWCAFSGQNDDPDAEGEEGGRVQSWGDGVQEFVRTEDPGTAGQVAQTGLILEEGPGTECKGLPTQD